MRVTDSRDHGGVGILPLQDHSGQSFLEDRFQVNACRVLDRGSFGDIEWDDRDVGDLLGGFQWREFDRENPAWGFVFGSTTVGRRSRTSAQRPPRVLRFGARPDPNNPPAGEVDQRGGGNGTPQRRPVPRPGQSDGVGGGNPNGASNVIAFGSAAGITVQDSQDHDNDILPVLPIRGTLWRADERFTYADSPKPKLWPYFPEDWKGLTVADTDEGRQAMFFHPTDPRIPLIHVGSEPKSGALVCDMEPGTRKPDEFRHARLHTMLRVIKGPSIAPRRENSVAWNITTTGRGDGLGGLVVDVSERSGPTTGGRDPRLSPTTPSSGSPSGTQAPGAVAQALRDIRRDEVSRQFPGAVRQGLRNPGDMVFNTNAPGRGGSGIGGGGGDVIVAAASHNYEGPFHPGIRGDPHKIGTDSDRHEINPLHLNIGAYFIDPKRTERDGPLNVTRFVRGDDHEFETRVYFGWDRVRKWWDWWTTSPEELVPPPTDVPVPPNEPPTTPPQPPPNPPQLPPPTTPGDPDPIPPPPPLEPPTTPPQDLPPGPTLPPTSGPNAPYGFNERQRSGSAQTTLAISHSRRWLEMSTAAQSFRAQLWGDGEPNVVRTPSHPERPLLDASSPTVGRMEVFAAQSGRAFEYTNKPGASRYEGGTASGGLWYLPPEVTGEDYDDFTPGDRSISETVLGVGPGARLGIGLPDKGTGSVRRGHSLYAESGDLVADYHDASGTTVKNFRLTADGALQLRIIVTPTAPPSGYINLYAKSDGIYWQTSAGTETGPMSS